MVLDVEYVTETVLLGLRNEKKKVKEIKKIRNFFFIENPDVRNHIKDLVVDDGMKIRRILQAIKLTVLAHSTSYYSSYFVI